MYKKKKTTSIGTRINIPKISGGLITTSGSDAKSPIRTSEVVCFGEALAVLLTPRSANPKNSLRS